MEQLTIDGQPIGYQIIGKGKPVLFLHGFCEDKSIWEEFLEPMEEEPYQYILADLPGFGDSPLVTPASVRQMADIILRFLDEVGIESCLLIGHSLGGYVSLEMAAQQGHRIEGLVLFHSHPFSDSEEKQKARNKSIEFVQQNGHELYVKQLFNKLFYPLFISSHRYILDRLIYHGSNYEPSGITNALEAMRDRSDHTETLKSIECPVQFIIGAEEEIIPHDLSMEQTHLPAIAHIEQLPRVNHMGMFEASKACRKILKNFFSFVREHRSDA